MQDGSGPAGVVRVLGPVVLQGPEGEALTNPSTLLRTLLALLASRPGEVVSTDTLIDELWGEATPRDPKKALQVQMTRLRGWLARGGVDRAALRNEHRGYLLAIDPTQVDVVRFGLAAAAAERAADPEATVAACDAALAEWRDDPFGGCVVGLVLEAEQVRHREVRLRTIGRRVEALLALGRADEAVVDLAGHRRRHPSRERFTELAMIALYRTGRQQEALAAFAETRQHLAEEHGLPPGEALVRTEAAVLAQDPALLHAPVAPALRRRPLPPLPLIVGRDEERAVIAARLRSPERGGLVVVTGEAGAGKTTLAAAAANDAAEAGAAVGVGAFDDDSPLAGWRDALDTLGADPEALSDDQRARAVRAALANVARDRPALVVLEDAHAADTTSLRVLQALVRIDLPPGVVVLVTARVPDVAPHDEWASTAADLARADVTTLLPIGALSRPEADLLVATRLTGLGRTSVATVAAELWGHTTGHPLHLTALLDLMGDSASESDCLAAARRVPPMLGPLLDHQLGSIPDGCRDLVEALAVTGPVAVDAVAALLGVDPLLALRTLRPALQQGLVVDAAGTVALRHALWTTAVVEGMGAAVAEELHLRRLRHLAAVGADPFDVLRHAVGAGGRIAPGERAGHRAAAGRAAFARGAYDEAADLLTRAAPDAGDDVVDVVDVRLHQGLALAACGQVAEADDLLDAVVFRSDATVEQVVAAAVGHELLGFRVVGDPRRLARLDEAHRLSEAVDAPRRIEVIRALLIEESLVHDRPPSTDARAELDRLVVAAEPDLDPAQRARLRAMQAREVVELPITSADRLAHAREAHRAAVAADEPSLVLDSLELLVSATLAAGLPHDEVEDVRWELQQTAERVNRPRSRWAASLLPAAVALARGDDDAEALAVAALDRGFEMGIPDALGAYGVHLVTSRFLTGDLGDVVGTIDGAMAQYPTISAWPAAGALARSQMGDGEGAREHLRLFLDRRDEQHTRYFDRPGLAMAAAAAWIAGDHPVCREVAQVVVDHLPSDPDAVVVVGVGAAAMGPVDLYVALALATLGRGPDALARATSARSLASRLRWDPWVRGAGALADQVEASLADRTPPPVPGPPAAPTPLGLRRLP